MALRWYSTVIDSHDVAALARWWAETLSWSVVYEDDDEVSLAPGWVDADTLARVPWERVGPGLTFVPVPETKATKNRLHIDLAPHTSDDRDALVAGLVSRGAARADVGQPDDVTWTVLTDPEGNEFCVLSSRDS
ncbi:MAG: VOC family protein [Lapillicoccus sp.]